MAHFSYIRQFFGRVFVCSFRIFSNFNDIVSVSLTGSNQTIEATFYKHSFMFHPIFCISLDALEQKLCFLSFSPLVGAEPALQECFCNFAAW